MRQLSPPINDAVSSLCRIFPTAHSKLPPAMRRVVYLAAIILIGCGPRAAANSPSATPNPTISPSGSLPAAIMIGQDPIPVPAGMTLRQEIGAVMMVGSPDARRPAVLDNCKQRQFGR